MTQFIQEMAQLRDLANLEWDRSANPVEQMEGLEQIARQHQLWLAYRWLRQEVNRHRFENQAGDIGVIHPT